MAVAVTLAFSPDAEMQTMDLMTVLFSWWGRWTSPEFPGKYTMTAITAKMLKGEETGRTMGLILGSVDPG